MDGESLEARGHKIIGNEIGYHRVNMSMMLAGASWAVFVSRVLATGFWTRVLIIMASAMVLLGQSLTAGRAGYVTWAIVGLALCLVRWKRYLIVAPLLIAGVVAFMPGVSERMTKGFDEETRDTNSRIEAQADEEISLDGSSKPDLYTVTSGRVFAWPYVIDKIREKPLWGYGKAAMIRTGLTDFLRDEFGEGFPHPHNAYLELLFDSGLAGFIVIIPFYILIIYYSLSLFRDSRSPVFMAAGGISAALVIALLSAAMGSQTFYPREGAVGMWSAMALMLRIWVERRRAVTIAQGEVSVPVPGPTVRPLPGRHARLARRPAGPARRSARRPRLNLDPYLWRKAA